MKKIIHFVYLITISFLVQSCHKDEKSQDVQVCFVVKDELTGAPVEGAWLQLYTVENGSSPGSLSYDANTDENGSACITYNSLYPNFSELRINKDNYEVYCNMGANPVNMTGTNEIILKKRSAFIKFHLVNQPPIVAADSFALSAQNPSYSCFEQARLILPPGSPIDTFMIIPVVSGSNFVSWDLLQNHHPVKDSSFTIATPLNDTINVLINY
jgi:hypothetical protein